MVLSRCLGMADPEPYRDDGAEKNQRPNISHADAFADEANDRQTMRPHFTMVDEMGSILRKGGLVRVVLNVNMIKRRRSLIKRPLGKIRLKRLMKNVTCFHKWGIVEFCCCW